MNPNPTLSLWGGWLQFCSSRGAPIPPPSDQCAHHGGRQHVPMVLLGWRAASLAATGRQEDHVLLGGAPPKGDRPGQFLPPLFSTHIRILPVSWDLSQEAQGKYGRGDKKQQTIAKLKNETEGQRQANRSTYLYVWYGITFDFFFFPLGLKTFSALKNGCERGEVESTSLPQTIFLCHTGYEISLSHFRGTILPPQQTWFTTWVFTLSIILVF